MVFLFILCENFHTILILNQKNYCIFALRLRNQYRNVIFVMPREMAERSNAAVLKTVDCNRSGGSNPSLSANKKCEVVLLRIFYFFSFSYSILLFFQFVSSLMLPSETCSNVWPFSSNSFAAINVANVNSVLFILLG